MCGWGIPVTVRPEVATYFDVGDHQIVVYSVEEITGEGDLRMRGTVLEVSGKGKRSEERFSEYHLLVDDWSPAE